MTELKKKTVLWRFFASVKLTLALLIILAIACILGTFVPQREDAIEFARQLSPALFKLFHTLDLFDMYHAAWFRIIIGILAINLIICSIERFPGAWKRFKAEPRPDRQKPFENIDPGHQFVVSGTLDAASGIIRDFLAHKYKTVHQKETKGQKYYYCEKGRLSHFGVYLVHLSVLIIIIGALIGSFLGFEGYVNILEGDSINRISLRKNMAPYNLGFSVRCDKFVVEFYEDGAPKEYRSELSFLVNGKLVKKATLLVNHPVQWQGITFYQSSYGTIPGDRVRIRIEREGKERQVASAEVKIGEKVELPNGEGTFTILQVKENFMRMGPAMLVSVESEGPQGEKTTEFWVFHRQASIKKQFPGIFERFQKLNPSAFRPYTFFLDGMEARYYTGLQVNKDPGVPIVWLGCFLMIVGLFVAFFTSHRRIWIKLESVKNGVKITLAGMSSKNPVGLERELDNLASKLKGLFN